MIGNFYFRHIANTCAEYRVNFYWYETGMNFYIDNKRYYNLNHCVFCSNQDMCNGCSKCGNCGSNYALVDKKMLHYYQNVIQADRLINHGNFDKTLYYNGLYNHLY